MPIKQLWNEIDIWLFNSAVVADFMLTHTNFWLSNSTLSLSLIGLHAHKYIENDSPYHVI